MKKRTAGERKDLVGDGPGEAPVRADWFERAFVWLFYLSLVWGASVFLPDYFYDGFEVPKLFGVQAGAGLMLGLLIARAAFKGGTSFKVPAFSLLLPLVLVIAALSVFWSLNRGLAVERLFHISALSLFFVFAWRLCRIRSVRGPYFFIVLAAGAIAVFGVVLDAIVPLRLWVYPHYLDVIDQGNVQDLYRPLTANQGNPNYLIHILVLTIPMALGMAVQETAGAAERHSPGRTVLAGLALLSFGVSLYCVMSYWNRSGLVATWIGMILFASAVLVAKSGSIWKAAGRFLPRLAILAALLIVAAAALVWLTPRGRSLAERAKDSAGAIAERWGKRFGNLANPENIDVYSRVVFLESGWKMFKDDPLLGKGVGQFVIYYPLYKSEKNWERFNFLDPPIKRWSEITRQTHNEYLQILVELGLVALAAFVLFWIFFAFRVFRCVRRQGAGPAFYLVLGAGAGIAGTLCNALFTFPLQTVTSAVFFWSAAGLALAVCTPGGDRDDSSRLTGRELVVRLPLRSTAARTGAIVLALAVVCTSLWGATALLRSQYFFFDALKNHARDLKYSIRQNGRSIEAVPFHFESRFVQGWLGLLDGDTTLARASFEQALELAPYFPETYHQLPILYYNNRDYARAEKLLTRFEKIYPLKLHSEYYFRARYLMGLICLRDTTVDRTAEAEKYLQEAKNPEGFLELTAAYYRKGKLDQAGRIAQELSAMVSQQANLEYYLYAAYYSGLLALARGEGDLAREEFNKILLQNQGRYPDLEREVREILQEMDRRAPPQSKKR